MYGDQGCRSTGPPYPYLPAHHVRADGRGTGPDKVVEILGAEGGWYFGLKEGLDQFRLLGGQKTLLTVKSWSWGGISLGQGGVHRCGGRSIVARRRPVVVVALIWKGEIAVCREGSRKISSACAMVLCLCGVVLICGGEKE